MRKQKLEEAKQVAQGQGKGQTELGLGVLRNIPWVPLQLGPRLETCVRVLGEVLRKRPWAA